MLDCKRELFDWTIAEDLHQHIAHLLQVREDHVAYVTQHYRLLSVMTAPLQKRLYPLVDDYLKVQAFELESNMLDFAHHFFDDFESRGFRRDTRIVSCPTLKMPRSSGRLPRS